MDLREQRGKVIAQQMGKRFIEDVDGWIIPSQTTNKRYFVRKDFTCSCPDCKNRGVKCKHAFAVEFYLQKVTRQRDGSVVVENKRLTYPQAWAAYDKSQIEEKARFLELLNDLIEPSHVPEKRGRGQPKINDHDLLFSAALKVYTQFSLRRFMSDLNEAQEKGFVSQKPCFASVGHYLQREDITSVIKGLVQKSASVLKGVEARFSIDSTGFRTTRFNEYCQEKHGKSKEHVWLKLHAVVGCKTNVICACNVTSSNGKGSGDSPNLIPLATQTNAAGFNMQEFSADMAYMGRDNFRALNDMGATPYIPFREGTTGKPYGKGVIWRKMFNYFQYHKEEFMTHYHARSNVESTFSALKAKFNDTLKSKTPTAQVNELLLKVLCFNIVQVVHETNEKGVLEDLCK